MQAIRVLGEEVVNLISAGEVVERPASIVKELVENALDAGASAVEVEIERGGRQSITVRDDGSGMSRHDLLLSIQRHATSKITAASDLDRISTLGFRGEALPSIAAVTHMTIVTSDGSVDGGWKLTIDGGVLSGVTPAARTRGTTVTAAGIFFNQPARRKFLRSEQTEESWIQRHLEGLAFARNGVSTRLVCDGRTLFSLPAGTLESRMRERFAIPPGVKAFTGRRSDGTGSAGILLFPDKRFASRQHGYTVLNGRPISVRAVSFVLEGALSGPSGTPLYACSLELDPSEFDVNVHPAKMEARMRRPSLIQALVGGALSDASGRRVEDVRRSIGPTGGYRTPAADPPAELFEQAFALQGRDPWDAPTVRTGGIPVSSAIHQVGRSYLVSAVSGGIVIIDPHAAHERVLFESMRRGAASTAGGQRLLLPETLDLDADAAEQLHMYADMIAEAGFDIEESGGRFLLRAVPEGVRHGTEAVSEILSSLSDPSRASLPPQDQIAAAAACAGAVKLGDVLDPVQAGQLLDMLFATSDPFHCPHGRPTLIEISNDELSRRFGR